MLLKLVGYRTYISSAIVGILAVLLQADSQGILVLAPLVKITFSLGLAILLPTIPVFLRKAIDESLNKNKDKK